MKAPILASAVALVALTISPALGLVGPASSAHAGDGVKALKLMPADTNIAFNINLKRLRTGKAYEEMIKQARNNGKFTETETALKEAGVDVKKDIDTVTLGMRAEGKGDPDGFVVVVEGRFKESKIVATMKKKNADLKTKKRGKHAYYIFGDDGAMAFLGKNLVIAKTDRMSSVIDRFKAKGRKSAAKSRVMKGMLSRTDTKKDIWFVAEIRKGKSGFGVPMADDIKSVVGSLDLIAGLGLRLRIAFANTKTPRDLASQFESFRPMAAQMPEVKQMGLDVFINKAQLDTDEKDLILKVDLTAKEAEKLKGLAETMGNMGAM